MRHLLLLTIFCTTLFGCGPEPHGSKSQTKGIGACIEGHLANQCVNQKVCKVVCSVAGTVAGAKSASAGAKIGAAAGGEVCNELCELEPECSDIYVCDRYERGGP